MFRCSWLLLLTIPAQVLVAQVAGLLKGNRIYRVNTN